jgi:predicted nuclease with TOPRIM domain
MNYYPNYNQFYQPQMRMQQPINQRIQQPIVQPVQPIQNIGLQGKSVDSIDVVKAMDIPLDGTVSYFPLTDGTAIVSKQLQMDGTSKTIIYKPIKEENKEVIQNNTNEDLINKIKEENNTLKEGMDIIKNQIQDMSENFDKLFEEMKSIKGGKK